MIRQEWKRLLHNKILLIVLAAILAIPTIYTTLFLGSMWDPYGRLDRLPVGVVNKDRAVTYNGKTLHVGAELADSLREDQSLQFEFVDSETAREGLEGGDYYMVITIPEDFSADAATLLDKNPKKMELLYETNPGKNYIASKMSESAMEKIKSSVAEEVTRTYAEVMFGQIEAAGDGMQEAADGSAELGNGLQEIWEGNREVTDNLQTLADSTLTLREGSDVLVQGLGAYTDGVSRVDSGARELEQGLGTLASGIQELEGKTPELLDGTARLDEGAKTLKDGSSSLAEGVQAYTAGGSSLAEGTQRYVVGTGELIGGIRSLEPLEALGDVSGGITQLRERVCGTKESESSLKQGAQSVEEGLGRLNSEVKQLAESASGERLGQLFDGLQAAGALLSQSEAGISGAKESIDGCAELIGQTADALALAAGDMESAQEQARQIAVSAAEAGNEAIGQANGVIQNANARIDEASALIQESGLSEEEKGAVLAVLAEAKGEGSAELDPGELAGQSGTDQEAAQRTEALRQELLQTAQELEQASGRLDTSGLAQASEALGAIAQEIPELPDGMLDELSAGLEQAYGGAAAVSDGVDEVSGALEALEQATAGFPEAARGIHTLVQGAEALDAAGEELTGGAAQLLDSSGAVTDGALRVKEGAEALAKGTEELKSGAKPLAEGTEALAAGAGELKAGAAALTQGSGSLADSSGALTDGASQLADGTSQLAEGASQLAEGAAQLGNGIGSASEGNGTLTASLADGAAQVKAVSHTEDTLDMFAGPVEAEEAQLAEVPDNGHAMAAYMMSVGLWVGCIAFCIMYPLAQYGGRLKSGFSWWLSKATVVYPLAAGMALFMVGMLYLANGFRPSEFAGTLAAAVLASVAFMSILYFFNLWLGKVGSFLMLIFMVVQLAGSAGTYPVELSGGFVAKIHRWLPFSYTVDLFRATIAGQGNTAEAVWVLGALAAVFTLLTILLFRFRAQRIRAGKRTLYDFIEKAGLA